MTDTQCPCANFERLEGSAVRIYIALYLEETSVDEKADKAYYICKYCGRPWTLEKILEIKKGGSTLTRMETEYNV
jgi:hypothetical protein